MKYLYITGQVASNPLFSKFVNTIDTEFDSNVEFLIPAAPTGVRLASSPSPNTIVVQHALASSMPIEHVPLVTKLVPIDELSNVLEHYDYVLAATVVSDYQIKEPELIAKTRFFAYNASDHKLVDVKTLQEFVADGSDILLPLFSMVRFGTTNTYVITTNSIICAIPSNIDYTSSDWTFHTIGETDEPLNDEIMSPDVAEAMVLGDILVLPPKFTSINFFGGRNVKVTAEEQHARWECSNASIKTNLDIATDRCGIRVRPKPGTVGYLQIRFSSNKYFNMKDGIGGSFEYNKIIIQE